MFELFLLLLPVAALSGWYAARVKGEHRDSTPKELSAGYFKGIGYLGNEEPDKAIDTFIQTLEVDNETVETHLALGNLYRRRGEVDRAIRIHQNVITRSTLSNEEKNQAMLELGQDYMSAGLLDRAEDLFRELAEAGSYRAEAQRQLVQIYEREKDWDKAIAMTRDLEAVSGANLGTIIAHYHCEQAKKCKRLGKLDFALELVQQALSLDAKCVRASLLQGDILFNLGDLEGALEAYRRIEGQNPNYLPESIPKVRDCLLSLERVEEMNDFLLHVLTRYGGVTAALALAEHTLRTQGQHAAAMFMAEQLLRQPSVRGCEWLLEISLSDPEQANSEYLLPLKRVVTELLAERPVYRCEQCGFPARSLYWQCPGCRHWGTVKPICGIEGE
jgi:lipopolysaccharide biosynthesis regulator YciM